MSVQNGAFQAANEFTSGQIGEQERRDRKAPKMEQRVAKAFTRIQESHDQKQKRYAGRAARAYRYYRNRFPEDALGPNAAVNTHSPIKQGVDLAAPRLVQNLTSIEESFSVQSRVADRQQRHWHDRLLNVINEYILTKNQFRQLADPIVRMQMVTGASPLKITPGTFNRLTASDGGGAEGLFGGEMNMTTTRMEKEDLPNIELVPMSDLYLDPSGKGEWVAHVYKKRISELRELADRYGMFSKQKVGGLDKEFGKKFPHFDLAQFNLNLAGNHVNHNDGEVTVVDIWGKMTDSDGEFIVGSEDRNGYMAISQNKVIAPERPIPFMHGRIPFVVGQAKPDFIDPYPDAIFFNQLDNIKQLWFYRNQLFNRASYDINPAWVVNSPSALSERHGGMSNDILRPNKVITRLDDDLDDKARPAMEPLKAPELGSLGQNIIGMIERQFQQSISTEMLSGARQQGTPPSAAQAETQAAQVQAGMQSFARAIDTRVMSPAIELIVDLGLEYRPDFDDPSFERRLGPQGARWARSLGDNQLVQMMTNPKDVQFDGFSKGLQRRNDENREARTMIEMRQSVAQVHGVEALRNWDKEIMYRLGLDPERIFPNNQRPMGPPQQQGRDMQLMQQMQQAQQAQQQ